MALGGVAASPFSPSSKLWEEILEGRQQRRPRVLGGQGGESWHTGSWCSPALAAVQGPGSCPGHLGWLRLRGHVSVCSMLSWMGGPSLPWDLLRGRGEARVWSAPCSWPHLRQFRPGC